MRLKKIKTFPPTADHLLLQGRPTNEKEPD